MAAAGPAAPAVDLLPCSCVCVQDDSMDVADRQPAFLKDKGDGFAAQGNYRWA